MTKSLPLGLSSLSKQNASLRIGRKMVSSSRELPLVQYYFDFLPWGDFLNVTIFLRATSVCCEAPLSFHVPCSFAHTQHISKYVLVDSMVLFSRGGQLKDHCWFCGAETQRASTRAGHSTGRG